MRVDISKSAYHEDPEARSEFSKDEWDRCRLLLRRLRFLEHQVRETGGLSAPSGSGGAAFAEMEIKALEWILEEVGFLAEKESA